MKVSVAHFSGQQSRFDSERSKGKYTKCFITCVSLVDGQELLYSLSGIKGENARLIPADKKKRRKIARERVEPS